MEKKDYPPPDFSDTPHLNVSEKAKQVIERLEPGVHIFLAVEFLNVRRLHLENRYWFRAGHRIDSLDPERSTLIRDETRKWRPAYDIARWGKPVPAHIDLEAPSILVFSAKAVGQAHIWQDDGLSGTLLSDEAARTFQAEGLTGLRLEPGQLEMV